MGRPRCLSLGKGEGVLQGEMSYRESPASTRLWPGPPTQPPPSDIRKKQLPLDIPSLLQSLRLLRSLRRSSGPTAEEGRTEGPAREGEGGLLRGGGSGGTEAASATVPSRAWAQRLRVSDAERTSEVTWPGPLSHLDLTGGGG